MGWENFKKNSGNNFTSFAALMKILMLLPGEFPPDIRVENEAMALAKAGHEISIACLTRKELPSDEFFKGKVIIKRFKIPALRYKSSIATLTLPFYFNFWRNELNKLLLKNKYDAIHVHDLPLAQIGFEVSKKLNAKFVLDLHENWPGLLKISEHTQSFVGKIFSHDQQWRNYEKRMCNLADKVIVVVEEAQKRLENLGIEHNKITVVSNTLNIESFDKLPKYKVNTSNTNNFNIFYGGGINKHRGIQIVIRGIALLNDHFSDFNFDIVGDGKYLEKLIKLSVTLNISSRIKFYGYLPFGEMLAILQNANVAVIPHLKSEHTDTTIPHKIFQYIYAGIPILSSDCNPLRRIIEETHSGIIYKNDSPTDFAENLIELKNLISLGKFNPEYGRTFIVNKYNWDKDAQKLIQLYSEFDQTK
ncbi:MAG TPA: glycosyltransferase family 4 protein [Bacteroidales bacterium]|jgi:glycosyltransferase involved in cell wall biosynthesis|nr:MAG: Glycogen synthase [Bacteroidetes bacterium ADurb.Bin028]HNQ59544.1 glycosyltransferase family 4 protein [Bacteroidales bacterium]HNU21212.1 glycosyltransferase family 4 protein [Bacteroidales bacterium]HNV16768.1 glycosyltransferase family 4 protein [Bacteroidales bacterium]HOX79739.1 glycosyltransferase family 4 protein [Bacteroidales bacterium]